MKLAVALAVVISSSLAAPTDDALLKERTRKSALISPYGAGGSYGGSYGSPCSGAAPLQPIALYLAPQGAPHYREEGEEQRMHEEHSEQARSYEGPSYGASSSAISLASPSSGAIGYFPHGKIGPCGVPLLLSCAPNVIAGHLAQSHGYAAPAYKQSEKEEETTELREATEKSWAEAEREAHNAPHHHHLEGVILKSDTKAANALGDHDHSHTHNTLM